jgi:hypothetical protein
VTLDLPEQLALGIGHLSWLESCYLRPWDARVALAQPGVVRLIVVHAQSASHSAG